MPEGEVSLLDSAKAQKIREQFKELLNKTNRENPRPNDVKALSDLLHDNQSLELWRTVYSAGQFAEHTIIENAPAVPGVKECWRQRLTLLRKELGYVGAPMLEQLLIYKLLYAGSN